MEEKVYGKFYAVFRFHSNVFYYDKKSLFLFDGKNILRRWIVWLVEWYAFKVFILSTVLANSILLASHNYEYRINPHRSQRTELEKIASKVFISIFLLEFILKVIAMGFVLKKHSYMRSGWNILDLICLITAILEQIFTDLDGFMMLRMLRFLRPLRSIKAIPSLQLLVNSLFASLRGLLNIYMFLAFVLSFFAIFGVNLFSGQHYRVCRATPELIYVPDESYENGQRPIWPFIDDTMHLCSQASDCYSLSPSEETAVCGSVYDSYGLDPKEVDQVIDNRMLSYGLLGYDNFSQALLTVFQICTLEGWSDIMFNQHDSTDYPATSYIYHPLVVTVGSFFTLNLILAQIIDSYTKQTKKMQELQQTAKDAQAKGKQVHEKEQRLNQVQHDSGISAGSHDASEKSSVRELISSLRSQKEDQVRDFDDDDGDGDGKQESCAKRVSSEESKLSSRARMRILPDIVNPAGNYNSARGFKDQLEVIKISGGVSQLRAQGREDDQGQKIASQNGDDEAIAVFSPTSSPAKSKLQAIVKTPTDQKTNQLMTIENNVVETPKNERIQTQTNPDATMVPMSPSTQTIIPLGNTQQSQVVYQKTRSKKNLTELLIVESEASELARHSQLQHDQPEFYPQGKDRSTSQFRVQTVNSQPNSQPHVEDYSVLDQQSNHQHEAETNRQSEEHFRQSVELIRLQGSDLMMQSNSYRSQVQVNSGRQSSNRSALAPGVTSDHSSAHQQQAENQVDEVQEEEQPCYIEKKMTECVQPRDSLISAKLQASTNDEGTKENKPNLLVKFCYKIVCSPLFNILIMLLIILNTMVLASYRYDQSPEETSIKQKLDYFFVCAFTVEVLLKLVGLGPRQYIKDGMNIFDASLVVFSLIELILARFLGSDDLQVLGVLKATRAIRMLKITRYNEGMRQVLKETYTGLKSIGGFTLVVLLFIFIWALLGMELFAYMFVMDEEFNPIRPEEAKKMFREGLEGDLAYPRENFNSFWDSVISVYILVNGEDWNNLMSISVRFYEKTQDLTTFIPILYCVVSIILGNLTLLALFTGMLIQNSKDQQEDQDDKYQAYYDHFWDKKQLQMDDEFDEIEDETCCQKFCRIFGRIYKAFGFQNLDQLQNKVDSREIEPQATVKQLNLARRKTIMAVLDGQNVITEQKKSQSVDPLHYNLSVFARSISRLHTAGRITVQQNVSLGCFGPTNRFRKLCNNVCQHWGSEVFIALFILASSITLTFDSPLLDPDSELLMSFKIFDIVTTFVFLLEAIIKIVAFGFIWNGKYSYLKNPWNVLDSIILLTAIVDLILSLSALRALTTVRLARLVRILRPMRIIAKNQNLQVALTSLLNAMPQILKLQFLTMFFLFMVAIIQTFLFGGTFYRCYTEHLDLNMQQSKSLIETKWDCLNYGGEWIRPDLNFDTLGDSFWTITSIASREGWTKVLWNTIDSKAVDEVPVLNNNLFIGSLYTMALMFIITLLFLNLFIGVVIETFNHQKALSSYNQVLNPQQRYYLTVLLQTFTKTPVKRPKVSEGCWNSVRQFCLQMIEHKGFIIFILVAIVIDTIQQAYYYFMITEEEKQILLVIDRCFFGLFCLEALIKIIAQSKEYFKDRWNQFDFSILTITAGLLLAIHLFNADLLNAFIRVTRIFRIIRLLNYQSLQLLFDNSEIKAISRTLIDSAPVMASFGLLFLLFIYMFAVIGMHAFSMIDLSSAPGLEREMGYHINFQNFKNAFMTLFRCSTGEDWNSIMFETGWSRSILYQCNPDENYDSIVDAGRDPQDWRGPKGCGQIHTALIFFGLFHLLISQIYLNVLIAVIADVFGGMVERSKLPVSDSLIDKFVRCWSKYDVDATFFISIEDLEHLIVDLSKDDFTGGSFIHQSNIEDSQHFRESLVSALQIPTFGQFKKVMFYDILQKMCYRAFKISHNIDRIKENLKKAKVINSSKRFCLIEDMENLDDNFAVDFDEETLAHFKKLGKRIELISKFKQQARQLSKRFNNQVDSTKDVNLNQNQKQQQTSQAHMMNNSWDRSESESVVFSLPYQTYTTQHYIACCVIYRGWKQYKNSKTISDR